MREPLIEIKDFAVGVMDNSIEKVIVKWVDLTVPGNCIYALVGGSGSGKTTLGLSMLKLFTPGLYVKKGEIIFGGRNLLELSERDMQKIRGKEIGAVFQDPLDTFNPVFTIGDQIEEVLRTHTDLEETKRQKEVIELLSLSGIEDAKRISSYYPHQLSGGMRQRAMIAQAIAAKPKLIIADEPTSNLDVTLQARILELFKDLRAKLNLTIIIITHDLGLARDIADYIAVMKEGKIVEAGEASAVLESPEHEYSKELIRASGI
ncbi:MAG: ABC transporter ATP-binding protein [Candidatus Omnitrophica bacterium]|nr:ABC transporter ATP-binding protein [Candidatus Omnitrophota bacterium]